MPDSKLVLLSDGASSWEVGPRPIRVSRKRSGAAAPGVSRFASHLSASADPEDIAAAGPAYERLVALNLSRKLCDPSPIGRAEKNDMLRASGLPGGLYANAATEAIFAADADHLGKGGVLGSISKAVSSVGKTVSRVVAPVTNVVNDVGGLVSNTAQTLTGTVEGLNTAVEKGVTGFAGQAANFASSPAALSVAGDALGVPGIGGGSGGGSYDPETGLYSPAQPAASASSNTGLLIVGGGVVLLALILLTKRR